MPTWTAPFVSPALTLHIQNYLVITYLELLSKLSHCEVNPCNINHRDSCRSVISLVCRSVSKPVLDWLTDFWLVRSWSAVLLNVLFQLGGRSVFHSVVWLSVSLAPSIPPPSITHQWPSTYVSQIKEKFVSRAGFEPALLVGRDIHYNIGWPHWICGNLLMWVE